MVKMLEIEVEARKDVKRTVLGLERLTALVGETLRLVGRRRGKYHLSVLWTDDRRMKQLDQRYLNRRRSTDVLAFPDGGYSLGDIAISVPRASEQAAECGWSLRREMELLMVHGVLHLLGYDHEKDGGEMKKTQGVILEKWWSKS